MKHYFINLFNYDEFVNDLMIKTLSKVGEPEKSLNIMAHLLAAQQVWLYRIRGEQKTGLVLWPDWNMEEIKQIHTSNHKAWIETLGSLEDTDFEKKIPYNNLKGDSFESKVTDIITQVVNHGTHHRAQVGQLLKSAGIDPLPSTDFISYMRYIA